MRLTEILNEDVKGQFYAALKGNQPVILAYSENPRNRNLDIRGVAVNLYEWEKTMAIALSDSRGGYNEFDVKKVANAFRMAMSEFDLTSLKFIPGREGSVVLYVVGDEDELIELEETITDFRDSFCDVDEIHRYNEGYKNVPGPALRLWWD